MDLWISILLGNVFSFDAICLELFLFFRPSVTCHDTGD